MSEDEGDRDTQRSDDQVSTEDDDTAAPLGLGFWLNRRMLSLLALGVTSTLFQFMMAITTRDPTAAWGVGFVVLGVWMIVRGTRVRQRRIAVALEQGGSVDRTGLSRQYAGWLIAVIGCVGPIITAG